MRGFCGGSLISIRNGTFWKGRGEYSFTFEKDHQKTSIAINHAKLKSSWEVNGTTFWGVSGIFNSQMWG
jgi:hypothetical protein